MRQPNQSLGNLINALDKHGINTVLRQNEQGIIYGTYVDHQTKCVFNGSVLGKQYSAKGILERFAETQKQPAQNLELLRRPDIQNQPLPTQLKLILPDPNKESIDLLETLLQPEHTSGYVPNGLPGRGKKKKKKSISKRL